MTPYSVVIGALRHLYYTINIYSSKRGSWSTRKRFKMSKHILHCTIR